VNGSPIIHVSPRDSPDVLPYSGRVPSSSRIVVLVGLILIAVQIVWVYRQYPRDAIAMPDYVDLGEVDEDVELMPEIAIRNTSDQTIRCIGIPSRCDLGCVEAPQIPFAMEPGETHVTRMKFMTPSLERLKYRGITTRVVSESVSLYFDHPRHPKETVELRYSIRSGVDAR
jgi:hypothetical protein